MSEAVQQSVAHAAAAHDRYLEQFKSLLRIPSISTDDAYRHGIEAAVDWLVAEMQRIGFDNVQALPTDGQPLLYADWLHAGAARPTVLVYAHYDVQPVEPLSRWRFDPFEPTVADGRLYARGAMDDKCGVVITLKAFESMLATSDGLPLNVKLLFEGEEESGSPNMQAAVERYQQLLGADLLVISDGGSAPDQPHIVSSVRGIVDGEVVVRGPAVDLHSGKFGGVVHNPAHVVGRMIAGLHDDEGRILIAGFYDDVAGASEVERRHFNAAEAGFRSFQQQVAGVEAFWGRQDRSFIERLATEPTCDVNGIFGGYAGPGLMTIIPASAGFKVSMRIVPDQQPQRIAELFERYIRSFAAATVSIDVAVHSGSPPARLLVDGPVVDALQQAYRRVWGKEAVVLGLGGSIPIVGMLQKVLDMPMTLFGFGVGGGQHAPDEYLLLDHLGRGIATAIHFYNYLADWHPNR